MRLEQLPPPWSGDRPSIFSSVSEAAGRALPGEMIQRADDAPANGDELRYIDGLQDNLFGTPDRSPLQVSARGLAAAFGRVIQRPTADALRFFYEQLAASRAIETVDAFLERVVGVFRDQPENALAVSRLIARGSPDLQPVKFAIALLGVVSDGCHDDIELLQALGRYEELTLFCAIAFQHCAPDPETEIWRLARHVAGWGRINAVERLQGTQRADIQAWMLRDGFRNAVMDEYLAFTCATTGGLLAALRRGEPDEALVDGAGGILVALCNGGPAAAMSHYPDGAEVARLFLGRVAAGPAQSLNRVLAVERLRQFAGDEDVRPWNVPCEWSARDRFEVRNVAAQILQRPAWRRRIDAALADPDPNTFRTAAAAGEAIGLDVWPARLDRQQRGEDQWYFLMRTDQPTRIDVLLALASSQIDLARIATGPGTALGLGPEYADDRALDWILQELGRFPGRGWAFIYAGLRSRTTRGRNMALRALGGWSREHWPAEAAAALRAALAIEPEERVRRVMQGVIDGRSFEEIETDGA